MMMISFCFGEGITHDAKRFAASGFQLVLGAGLYLICLFDSSFVLAAIQPGDVDGNSGIDFADGLAGVVVAVGLDAKAWFGNPFAAGSLEPGFGGFNLSGRAQNFRATS